MPRDVATRAIFKVVYEHNLGIDGKPMVYLDLTHIDRKILDRKLEGILEIYEKFVGDDPRDTPMKIFPGMHYTMGGLWVDFKQATNIPGIFAAGEASINITAPTGWARTRWCRASSAEVLPGRRQSIMRAGCSPRATATDTSRRSRRSRKKTMPS